MKNSLKALLGLLVGGISLLGMEVSAVDSTNLIKVDLTNPVQHVGSVKFIQQGASGSVVLRRVGSSLLRAETTSGMNIIFNKNDDVNRYTKDSVILGGENNHLIGGELSTIIAGIENVIEGGTGNTILGGEGNRIEGGERFSTIIGGRMNYIKGRLSTILGGSDNRIIGAYSAVVGMNNSVEGNSSVAMGINSHVKGNNSFLWTDEKNTDTLEADDVFAVVSEKGMVINSDNSNDNVKLTVGGSLVINMNNKDKNVKCEGGQWGAGTLKTVFTGGHYCLCSCDGQEWNSMFGEGFCQSACEGDIQPVCGSGYRMYENHQYYFTGTCLKGYAVGGTGAYLIDKNNVLHWTCQTSDGATVGCSTDSIQTSAIYGTCEFNGTILSGDITNQGKVTAYLESEPAGECVSQVRTCRDGYLDGSYQYSTCTPGCKTPWNEHEYIKNGASVTGYKQSWVEFGGACESQVLTCGSSNYDELKKVYKYSSCTTNAAQACVYKGKSYEHGHELTTYSTSKEECPKACEKADFTCNNGKWVDKEGAEVELNQDPEPGQGAGGFPVTTGDPAQVAPIVGLGAYLDCEQLNSSSESEFTLTSCPEGGICSNASVSYADKENKTCSTPVTKYKLDSCNVGYALDSQNNLCVRYCTINGWMFGPGESYLAYQSENVPSGSNCVSETRTCQDDGTFDGSYQYSECHVGCSFDGLGYNHGDEVQGYALSSATCSTECGSMTGMAICHDGIWSASIYADCTQNNSTNYSEYPISNSCPSHGNCSSAEVYTANNTNKTCSLSTKYKLNSCSDGWIKQGNTCIEDTTKCVIGSTSYNNGASANGYSESSQTCTNTCQSKYVSVTCNNGVWKKSNGTTVSTVYADCDQKNASSDYTYTSCPTGYTCSSATVSVANGKSCTNATRYKKTGCAYGYIECNGADQYGCFGAGGCRAGRSCTYNGVTISHNETVNWFTSTSVPKGHFCTEVACNRTCNDGTLGGSSNCKHTSCSPEYSCFTAGTKVIMADGTQKNIEDVEIGEEVLGSNGIINTVIGYDRPVLGNRHLWSINGSEYFVSDEHPFMTTEGWKSFNPEMTKLEVDLDTTELNVGDILVTNNGLEKIKSVDYIVADYNTPLYNFVLDGDHTYYANSYLVHNKGVGGSSNGGGSVCFLAGTPVLTPDGSKNIEDIEEGDLVLSYNILMNKNEYNKVLKHIVHENSTDEVYELTIDGKLLEVTEWHPFYVIGSTNNAYQCNQPFRWVAAKDLKIGDQLMMSDGTYATIENISHRSNYGVTYNLSVDKAHNYFVGEGYLVHNVVFQGDNTSIGFGNGGDDNGGLNLFDLGIIGGGTYCNGSNGFTLCG